MRRPNRTEAVRHLANVHDALTRIIEREPGLSESGAEAHDARQDLREALIKLGVPAEDVFDHPERLHAV